MNSAVVAVGSNIDPGRHIALAREQLARGHGLLAESRFIDTRPIGGSDQPDFRNGAFLVATGLGRKEFVRELKRIERLAGRPAGHDPGGPRTLDLDLVVWNEKVVDQDFFRRDFLREAVLELLPELSREGR